MITSLLSSSLLVLLLNSSPNPIADIFVDASGANCATGTGTAADPVCSIATAIGLAAPGDTIRIEPGTYNENIVISIDLDLVGTGGADVTTIDGNGGSVVEIPAPVTVNIEGLTIANGSGLGGGGINAPNGGTLTLSNSTITGNQSFGNYGGGILVEGGVLNIIGSTISNNYVYGYGGGLRFNGTMPTHALTITDSTFHNNYSRYYGGGAMATGSGPVTVSGSTFSENGSGSLAGGLYGFSSSLAVTNSTFSGNTSKGSAGAIATGTVGASISHSTIVGNDAYSAGGILALSYSNLIEVKNSIIAGNTASSYAASMGTVETSGALTSLGFNIIGAGGNGFTNGILGDQVGDNGSPIDPMLGPLQANGGLTETRAPLPGSPALDAADPVSFEALDQRGVRRPVDAGPDIGSVEVVVATLEPYCFGDGSGADCPCMNNSPAGHPGGCANSAGNGAILLASGLASVAADGLNFDLESASPNSFALLVSGNNQLPQVGGCIACGIPSFDGLRCAGGGFLRHGSRSTDSLGETGTGWGPPGGPASGLIAANGFGAGQTRHFFAFYRDDPASTCQSGQNSSNGISVAFVP